MFDISKYEMSEILFILDQDEVYNRMQIKIDKEYMWLITDVDVMCGNQHLITCLEKAVADIKELLENRTDCKYNVTADREDTIEGYIYTIEIKENHYY